MYGSVQKETEGLTSAAPRGFQLIHVLICLVDEEMFFKSC